MKKKLFGKYEQDESERLTAEDRWLYLEGQRTISVTDFLTSAC